MTRTVSAKQEVTDLEDALEKMKRSLSDMVKNYQMLRSDCTTLEHDVKSHSRSVTDEVTTALQNYERELLQQATAVENELSVIKKDVMWLKNEKVEIQGEVMVLGTNVRSCEEEKTSLTTLPRTRPYSQSPPKTSPSLVLKRLSNENRDLRAQLRAINSQLDIVLESVTTRPKPSTDTCPEELKVASKKLPAYEYSPLRSYHTKLTHRVSQLQDSSYRVSLEQTVIEQEAKVKNLEASIAKMRKYRKQRENVLESVLETGQTPEMAAKLGDLQSEIVVLARKVAKVEKRNQQIAVLLEKLQDREGELRTKLAEAEKQGYSLSPELPAPSPQPPGLPPSLRLIENSLVKKKVRVHSLQSELKSLAEALLTYNTKLTRLSVDLDSKSSELQSISELAAPVLHHRKTRSSSTGKVFIT